LESSAITLLRCSNQLGIVHAVVLCGRGHRTRYAEAGHLVSGAAHWICLRQDTRPIHYVPELPKRCRTVNAISSCRRWFPAKFSTAASTENNRPLGLEP